MDPDEDFRDVVRTAHARATIHDHRWRLRRADAWHWWAPWRWERLCRRCATTYPCGPVRLAHDTLAGTRP